MAEQTRVHTGLTARAVRVVELTTLAARYGLGHFLQSLGFMRFGRRDHRTNTPERVRDFFAAAGTTFVKLGQKLSTRRDLLPPDYIDAFSTLQEHVPPPAIDIMRHEVEREIGKPIAEVFSEFSDQPVASASVGVVFRARLLAGGREVAVKIRRPGIRAKVAVDLAIVLDVAQRIEYYLPGLRRYQPLALAREFARALEGELDFEDEADRTERLRAAIAKHRSVDAPAVIHQFTTPRLLVTEWVEGIDPGDHATIDATGVDRHELARNLATSVIRQAVEAGCFHGDPHPGNVRITPAGTAVLLDFGNIVFIGRQSRDHLMRLLTAMFVERADQVITVLLNAGVVGPQVRVQLFQHDVDQLLARHLGNGGRPDFRELVGDFLSTVRAHELGFLPPEWVSLLLSVGMAENICRSLDPTFSLADVGRDLTREHRRSRLPRHPIRWLREAALQMQGMGGFFRAFPTRIERLLTQAEAGGLKLRITHDDTGESFKPLERMINRLTGGVVLSGMLIGGGLLLQNPATDQFIHSVGSWVMLMAAIGAVVLLWSVFRSGGT
ncbi:MAG: ABC1 kinase family protein [Planctomycetota bacterium]